MILGVIPIEKAEILLKEVLCKKTRKNPEKFNEIWRI